MLDIQEFLKAHYAPDELQEIRYRSKKPKMDSILEILQRVKKDPKPE